jgi:histidinol-phosphate/aromatic aminotransferase/cobyric acid decarboxylase-like protein
MDMMDAIVASVKKRDHKVVRVLIGEEVSDAVCDEMEAAGYVFACSPAAPKGQSFREFYFERAEPTSR